jgi:hypothetical protein
VRGSCDGSRTAGMFSDAVIAEQWDGVGTTAMAGTLMAQDEGASRWV